MVLPYTQVEYIFGTSAVSPALATYYGCIMGKATKIHDLVCKGWFTPGKFDCGGDGTTSEYNNFDYRDGVKTITPEGGDGALPYPGFDSGNKAVIDSVKTYFKNLKSVSLFQKDFLAIPLSNVKFRVTNQAVSAEDPSADDYFLAKTEGSDPEIKTITTVSSTVTLDRTSEGVMFVPGTFIMKTNNGYYISDLYVSGYTAATETEESKPIIKGVNGGKLYVYRINDGKLEKKNTKSTISYQYEDGAFVFSGAIELSNPESEPLFVDGDDKLSLSFYEASWLFTEGGNPVDIFAGTRCTADNGQDMFYLGHRAYTDDEYLKTDGGELTFSFPEGYIGMDSIHNPEDPAQDYIGVKEAFYKAEYQKMSKPTDETVVVSVGTIDHTTNIVQSNSASFNSNVNYAPCLGVAVCRVADDRPVRFDVDIDDLTGTIELDCGGLIFDTRDYDYVGGESVPLGNYDTDPKDDTGKRPKIYDAGNMTANFVSGLFRLEYEEQIVSPTKIGENGLYRTDLVSGDIEDYIGQPDPRNQLGYAYALVRQLTSADLYALVIDDIQTGFDTLEKYRDIFHIWYVSDNPSGANKNFYDWIDHENQKEQSRFRIGYQYQPIFDEAVKHERLSAQLIVDPDDTVPYTLHADGAQFISKDNVEVGDTVAEIDNETGKVIRTFTIQSVLEEDLTFEDPYRPTYSFTGQAVDDADPEPETQLWQTTEADPDKYYTQESTLISVRYKETVWTPAGTKNDVKVWSGSLDDIDSDLAITAQWNDTTHVFEATFIISKEELGEDDQPVMKLTRTILSCNFDARQKDYASKFNIYRVYNSEEKVAKLVGDQTSSNMACVTVLTRNVHYTSPVYQALSEEDKADFDKSDNMEEYKFMPDYATPGLVFGTKLATQPHMPLTLVSFSIDGMGDVTGLREFSRKQLERLLEAGYCMINSEIGMLPYCETDCTVGYRYYGDSDRGLLSKITPVLMYGKDVYNVTTVWKGPMNTGTPELLNGLGTALTVLKQKYTGTHYNLLGTLLKSVADASISFDGSHIIIEHHISSQDPARYIDNTVYVE